MTATTRVIKLVDFWYVETRMGYDGPFETYEEAETFLQLSDTAEVARMEFAGLAMGV